MANLGLTMTQLSKHFSVQEMNCNCGCGYVPPKEFMDKLEQLREAWSKPLTITSAARCRTYNAKVGGVPDSKHVLGQAVDVSLSNTERWALVKLAMELGWGGIGIANSFIHLDIRPVSEARIWIYSNK